MNRLVSAAAALLLAAPAYAGQFGLDWSTLDFPAGVTGPVSFTLSDPNGYRLVVTFEHIGGPFAAPAVAPVTPDDLALFGGSIEALTIIGDAPLLAGSVGESTIVTTMKFTASGAPYAVDGLTYDIHDIDASDNNQPNDRCDFVTVTGDSGIPTLSPANGTPAYIIGPGPGVGLTGPLTSNQAQCNFQEGPTASPTSNNDLSGTVRVVHPNGATEASIAYDESIGSIRGYTPDEDPYARGISTWGAVFFASTDQQIDLQTTVDLDPVYLGQTLTYTYTVTNNGDLALNSGQTIVIQDSRLGLVTCPAITADINPGGTFFCTAQTLATAADVAAGNISTTSTAGVGPSGQLFANRLQSNTENTVVATLPSLAVAADDFTGSPVLGITGGVAGDVLVNDTLYGVSIDPADVTLTETLSAIPQLLGAPVPVLSTSGATEGQVIVPAGTPEGIYTLEYLVCEDAVPGNCGTETITVAVVESTADLAVELSPRSVVTAQPVTELAAGDSIDWRVTVSNDGPGDGYSVSVEALLPPGYSYVSDDAATTGGTYNPATGEWSLGQLNVGTVRDLNIRAIVQATGSLTMQGQITASATPDPDSDPSAGFAVDDLGDGLPDDDEASASILLTPASRGVSGRVFFDNGAGGGTVHDGVLSGAEQGTDSATVEVRDNTGTVIARPVVTADGRWTASIPSDYVLPLTAQITPLPGTIIVSEATPPLPGLDNPSNYDGTITFTPAAGTDYAGLNVGLVTQPNLSQDQEAIVEAGQTAILRHEYVASSAASVSIVYAEQSQAPAGAFSLTLFRDADCDGAPETVLSAPIAVSLGDRICLVSRIVSSSGASDGASVSYRIEATTTFTGTPITVSNSDTDLVVVAGGEGRLVLAKTVRNLTQSTAESAANAGAVGDLLEYRILLKNTGDRRIDGVSIYDQTPAFTQLAAAIPASVAVGGDMTCSIAEPVANLPGYAGAIRWNCTGFMAPGDSGSVAFQVAITP